MALGGAGSRKRKKARNAKIDSDERHFYRYEQQKGSPHFLTSDSWRTKPTPSWVTTKIKAASTALSMRRCGSAKVRLKEAIKASKGLKLKSSRATVAKQVKRVRQKMKQVCGRY